MLSVVEKFISINGEGAHAGELAAFIRFRGCNLNCSYCDTKWANSSRTFAEDYTPEQLADWVKDKSVTNIEVKAFFAVDFTLLSFCLNSGIIS